jgi:adenylyl cyclase-associated protein
MHRSCPQVKGKVNGIVLDKCQRTGLVFEDVLAVCEVVNCSSVEVQCAKSCPSIAVDNCNGCQVRHSTHTFVHVRLFSTT